MTSSIKISLIGIALAGVGAGAYYVKHHSKTENTSISKVDDSTKLVSHDGGKVDEGKSVDDSKAVTPPSSVAPPVDANSEHVASPASPGLRDTRDDTERSWRPRPTETTEALPPISTPLTEPPAHTLDKPLGNDASTPVAAEPSAPPATVTETLVKPVTPATPEPARVIPPPPAGRISMDPATQPSSVPPKTTAGTPAAPQKMTVHVVQAGDTFSSLASKYLGSVKYANLIAKANPKISPNKLYVGAKLNIPAAPPVADNKTASKPDATTTDKAKTDKAKVTAPPVDPARAYTIKRGDKWEDLGKRFMGDKASWTVLYEMNRERFPGNSRTLQPGMVIEVPPKPASTTSTTDRTTSR